MPGWEIGLLVVALVLVLGVALVVLLASRRRWLAKQGAMFECSVRLRTATPSAGWVLGLARYSGDALEWFRVFSYAMAPRKSFRRGEVRVVRSRDPDAIEAVALYAGQVVVRLEEDVRSEADDGRRDWDLAMSQESLTGLMSWLEAAPPVSK